ncbi:MAG: 30S ribosome-binding factor RbfA [Spirochaetales bacterium]|nr:30S ribosome-binding factor RbfA [Candidatus Physcosoma equi]
MSEFSQERLESKILETISSLIVTGAIKNHNLSTLTSITRVELAPDNSLAKVFVSYLYDNNQLEKSVRALNQASGFIQARLARVLKTKNTPVLTFVKDNSYIEGERINKLIDEVMKGNNE